MAAELFIIMGIVLILIAIIFALPGLGIGMIFPLVGDVIDIPLSFVMGVVGVALIVLGLGLGFIIQYWWALLIVIVLYGLMVSGKLGFSIFRAKKRG